MQTKETLRLAYKAKRRALSLEEGNEGSKALCEHILASSFYKKATTIMAYLAMPKEPSLDALIETALCEGKTVYVPVCTEEPGIMVAAQMTSFDELEEGVLHIRTPKAPYTTIIPTALDLVLVPGVMFDQSGHRLGMGAGYYDRFLTQVPQEKRLGVAWNFQVAESGVPTDSYDELMGYIVTEKGFITCALKDIKKGEFPCKVRQ